MIEIGIMTAPRPVATIAQSIESLRKAGFKQDVNIFAEPGSDVPVCDGCYVHTHAARKGNFRNWVALLTWCAMQARNEWIMICEDDISWAPDAAATLQHDLTNLERSSAIGAISLYCPIRMSKVLERKYGTPLVQGWYATNLGRSTWGAQCLVFHKTWAANLLGDKALQAYHMDPRWDKNVDALVADVMARKGREILYRIPCLVDHTFGDGNSSLGYKPDRPQLKTNYFKGGI